MRDPLPEPALRERFLAEREIAGRFQHPNIIRVYDAGEDEDCGPYYVMEHAAGGTLATFVEHAQLAPLAAIRLVIDVALAVQHAHEAGVLHRDLKPANILLDADQRPRVTDFGVAKLASDTDLSPLGSTVVGAWAYMSPEQAAFPDGSWVVSKRTDVYGLGAILFELLEGRPPNSATSQRALHAWFRSEAETLRVSAAEVVSLELEAVCLKALALDPACRYPSAAALADDLRAVLGNRKTVATPRGCWRRLRTFAARHERLQLFLAAGLLSAGIVASFIAPLLQRQEIARDRERASRVDEQAATVELFFRAMSSTVRQVADDPVSAQILVRGFVANPATEFARYKKENPLVSSILLFTREGRPIARLPEETLDYFGGQFADREYLHSAANAALQGLDTAAYVSASFYSWRYGLLKIAFSVPVVDPETRAILGIAVATLEVSHLAHYFKDETIVLSAPQVLDTPGAQPKRHVARIGFGQGPPRSVGRVLPGAAMSAGKTLYRRGIGQSGYAVETEITGAELRVAPWAFAVRLSALVLLLALLCLHIANFLGRRAALARVRARGAAAA